MSDSTPKPSRFTWRTLFGRSSSAVYVFSSDRRLRYANPAWEELTGETFAKLRGTKVSATRRSVSPLAPPPEVWAGQEARVRRAVPGAPSGPPWWDITFVPLRGVGGTSVLAVIGFLSVVGPISGVPRVGIPEAVGEIRAGLARRFPFALFDGPSAVSQRLASQARAAAASEMPVWIVGEPGCGKETLARVIHHNGLQRERAFAGLSCGGVQPYLIEGMLFGKGGLTSGPHVGTLFLKRPNELPRPLQDRILSWCESAHGPRLVCGAGQSAQESVASGVLAPRFHTHYSTLELSVPPLRNRPEDIPHILDRLGSPPPAGEVIDALKAYHWPGNVRELAELVATCDGLPITRDALPRVIRDRHLIASDPRPPVKPAPKLDVVLEAVERRLIETALADAGGNLTRAAERLGIFRTRLGRRVDALGIRNRPDDHHANAEGTP